MDLPVEITRWLDQVVDSLEVLDVLALLARFAVRSWSAIEVAAELQVNERIAARALGRLRAAAVVVADADRPAWRMGPLDAEVGRRTAALLRVMETRRYEIVNHVANRQLQRIQSIADAFRLRQPSREAPAAETSTARELPADPRLTLVPG